MKLKSTNFLVLWTGTHWVAGLWVLLLHDSNLFSGQYVEEVGMLLVVHCALLAIFIHFKHFIVYIVL